MDQLTKAMVTYFLNLYEIVPVIDGFFSLVYLENKGAAWGVFSNNALFITILGIFFLLFLVLYVKEIKDTTPASTIALGFVLGGVVGNLLDRLIRGHVVDFLGFVIFGYHFPIFNIADVLIVVGVFLLALDYVVGSVRSGKRK